MKENKPIIQLENISYSYPGSTFKVLHQLDLEIRQSDRIGLVAPNGSGKTTLLHTIMGLTQPSEGLIYIFGEPMLCEADFVPIRSKIGLLFQDSDDQLFCPTVIDDVAFGPLNLGFPQKTAAEKAEQILERLGIDNLKDQITHRLSGGQKRLVALAAVLAMEPEVLLLDEPTAGLDSEVKNKLVKILKSLETAYFVISHEFDFLVDVTKKIYSMDSGRILTDDEVHIHRHEHIHRLGNHPHKHE